MDKTLKYLINSARPRQWLKNLSLFTGIVFSGWLFIPGKFLIIIYTTISFSILTSAVYILNDIIDIPKDKLHPLKKNRPLASGNLSVPVALFSSIILTFISLWIAYHISFFFFLLSLMYLIIHFGYAIWLKTYAIIDVMAIASGFIIRVYAGAVAINAHINVWLLLCIISFSLFLAIGKRRSERTLLKGQIRINHRKSLSHYPEKLIDIYTTMFANTTWLTYALFTFMTPIGFTQGPVTSILNDLPRAFINEKLLMFTVPIVIYGVMRYLQLIYDQDKGDSPAEVLLSDKPLLVSIFLWGLITIIIIYGIG